jgi:hypothetical protein
MASLVAATIAAAAVVPVVAVEQTHAAGHVDAVGRPGAVGIAAAVDRTRPPREVAAPQATLGAVSMTTTRTAHDVAIEAHALVTVDEAEGEDERRQDREEARSHDAEDRSPPDSAQHLDPFPVASWCESLRSW